MSSHDKKHLLHSTDSTNKASNKIVAKNDTTRKRKSSSSSPHNVKHTKTL